MKIKFFARRVHQIYFPLCIKWERYGIFTDAKKMHVVSILCLCWVLEWRFIPKIERR